ncbi:MAG: hypothetical protein HeimC2_41840 [Candidatus Heimdallarchaeota archaeon LC_2]|nr:MAG: hypothetical protein HeimC2_41840 [Candidatus Heimdallarchaeota archaeon LC_2]
MIREYRVEDHPEIVEICKDIWEGNDYLPGIINSLIDDPTCYPTVLIDNNKIMSVVNLRLYSDKIGWSEAMRSHPDYRGKGYATKLQRSQLELAKKLGCKEIWLSTAGDNTATKIMLERLDFIEFSKFYLLHVSDPPDEFDKDKVKKINLKKAAEIIEILHFPHLLGVFKVIPVDSDYAKRCEDSLYSINNRSVILIGHEKQNDLVVGFNGHADDIDTAISFASTFEHEELKLFAPPNTGLDNEKAFRFMIQYLD